MVPKMEVCEFFKEGECKRPASILCAMEEFDDYETWCGLAEKFKEKILNEKIQQIDTMTLLK